MSVNQPQGSDNSCFQIGCWQVNPQTNELINGKNTKRIEPKAMSVLLYLMRNSVRVISTEELLTQIWGDIVVTPNTVRRIIAQLRKVLHDNTSAEAYIQTIPRSGYQLIASHQVIRQTAKITNSKRIQYHRWALSLVGLMAIAAIWLLIPNEKTTPSNVANYHTQPITSLSGRELNPTLSANHHAIIFSYLPENSSNYQLRFKRLNAAQSIPLLGASGSLFAPAWSSTDKLAFADIAGGQCSIFIADLQPKQAKLTNIEQIFDCNNNGFPQLSWADNGKTLYFNSKDKSTNSYRLYQYQLATKQVQPLTFSQYPDDEFFKIVPSAQHNIFALISFHGQQSRIWQYDRSLHKLQLVFEHQGKNESIAWCLHGKTMMFGYQHQLWQVDNNGHATTVNGVTDRDFSYLTCHANMAGIYYTERKRASSLVTFKNPLITTITGAAEQNGYRFRSTYSEFAPAWANHSNRLAFFSDRLGSWQLFISDESDNLTTNNQLTFSYKPSAIHWSWDDSQLLLVANKQVIKYDLKSKQVTPLINEVKPISEALWSNNSDGVYYLTQQSSLLKYMDFSTNKITTKSHFGQAPDGISLLTHAPDKSSLFYLKNKQSDLWRLNLSTGEQSLVIADLFTGGYMQAFAHVIYFYRELGEQSGTYRFNYVNNQVTPVLTEFGDQGVQLAMSFDQKNITYVSQDGYQANIKVLVLNKAVVAY